MALTIAANPAAAQWIQPDRSAVARPPAQDLPAPSEPVRVAQATPATPQQNAPAGNPSFAEGQFSGPPAPLRAGDFIVNLGLDASVGYDDNIFRLNRDRVHDVILRARPQFELRSRLPRHELNILGYVEGGVYAEENRQNYLDAVGIVDGRFDVSPMTQIYGTFAVRRLHEERGTRNDHDLEPTVFNWMTISTGLQHRIGQITVYGGFRADRYWYDDTQRAPGFDPSNRGRDRWHLYPNAVVTYQVNDNWRVYAQGGYNQRDYDLGADLNGWMRDSRGFDVVGGIGYYDGQMNARIFGGFQQQNYQDARFRTINTFRVGAAVAWTPRREVTFRLDADRTIEETPQDGSSSVIVSYVSSSLEYEFLPRWVVRPFATFAALDYQPAAILPAPLAQTDYVLRLGVGLRYNLSESVFIGPEYQFGRRWSNAMDYDYTNNVVLLRFGFRR